MAFDKNEIQQALYEVIVKVFKVDQSTLKPETRFKEDLNVKSVHGMKMCAYLNYKFGVTIPMSNLVECDTLGDAVTMLDEFVNS